MSTTQSLGQELANLREGLSQKLSDAQQAVMKNSVEGIRKLNIETQAIKEGDRLPPIELMNATHKSVSIQNLLTQGPVVLTFYRGAWCPACNLQLHSIQEALPQIREFNASFVAISPQTPDKSMSQVEKENLQFEVLSDIDNKVARQLGLVYQVDKPMQELYETLGIDIPGHNDSNAYELPVTATFVIRQDGVVSYRQIDSDFLYRPEPSAIIEALSKLPKETSATR